ncbi:MAG: hypothetical protein EAX95_15740 [Candidatus Thorarchaeota archaeon]|nr:hypothetical protein [Candidatus Thorarchaeota archaeon]
MNIQDITLEVDLSRHDPNNPGEEQLYDETNQGHSSSTKQGVDFYVNDAKNYVESFWTGPWPECHVVACREDSVVCTIDLHVKVDLIGSFAVVESNSDLFGLQDMTETEQEIVEQDTIDAANSVWNDFSNVLAASFALASLVLIITTVAYQLTGIWQPWIVALGAWFGTGLTFMLVMHQQWLENRWTGEYAGFKFFVLCASLLGTVAGSLGGLLLNGCRSLTRMKQYWTYGRYFKPNSQKGWKGRSNSGNLVVALILFAALMGLSLHIALWES